MVKLFCMENYTPRPQCRNTNYRISEYYKISEDTWRCPGNEILGANYFCEGGETYKLISDAKILDVMNKLILKCG